MKSVRFQAMLSAAMFLCCLLPLLFAQPAAATTSAYVLSAPTVQSDYEGSLGTLYISEASYPMSLKNGDTLSISLPSCAELKTVEIDAIAYTTSFTPVIVELNKPGSREVTVNGAVYDYGVFSQVFSVALTGGVTFSYSVQVTENNRFAIRVVKGSTSPSYYWKFYIKFNNVYIKPLGPDDPPAITATLDSPSSTGFTSGSYTVANVAVGGTTASVDASLSAASDNQPIVPVLGADGGNVANIIIKENVPGSLKAGGGTVKLALDPGFTWKNVNVVADWGFTSADVSYTVSSDNSSGQSIINLEIINSTSSSAGRITVSGSVDVNEDIAQPGAIMVNYQGTNPGVTVASLTVGRYATSGVTVSQETTTDVVAGRKDQRLGQFSVQEQTPGDLAPGRTVTFTLPSGAKWNTAPTVVREAGDGELSYLDINSDKDVLRYKVTKGGSIRSSFIFKYGSVDLALDVPDALTVTLGGSANVSGTATIANVMQPVTLTADKVVVRSGVLNQTVGDITIKEGSAGALRAKDASGNRALLTLKLPSGVTFSEKPAVEVSEGNLSLVKSGISLDSTSRTLTIPIDISSSTPSAIKVSGIQADVDRTVPEGDLKLEVGGTAISQTSDIFGDSLNNKKIVIVSCGTLAPSATTGIAVFKIDQPGYTLNGQEVAMDVAPYIKDGRTMIPLRFAANAVGVTDSNIAWDGATGTVTLMRGDRVVQMQIGNKTVQINGAPVASDAAPEISGGRTMVPIRALGTALGASLEWNESDRTVTIKNS